MIATLLENGLLWKAGLCGLPLFVALCFAQEIALRTHMPRAAKLYRAVGRLVLLASVAALLVGGLVAAMS